MKKINTFISLVGLVFSTGALASPAAMEDVARILINNPLMAIPGYPACNDFLDSAEKTEVSPGINSYRLVWLPGGFCSPVQAIVTIVEDRTPTASDGEAIYKTSLEVKDQ